MSLPTLPRPLFAAACGLTLLLQPAISPAQERSREDRPAPADSPRPPRGEFRPDEKPRGDGRQGDARREDPRREEVRGDNAPRGERGGPRPEFQGRDNARPGEAQRGPMNPQFNPQELFRDLNEDQRAALRGFFESNQSVMREMGEKSMRLRREITESAMADKVNEDLIRGKIMEAAKLEAESTIARARAFAQVREKLPKETVERLRAMIAGMGPRPGFQPPMQGGRGEGDLRRPTGDQPGRGTPEGQFRRPEGREGEQFRKPAGEGDRRPEATERKPRFDGDRGPRLDGDRGPRPDGDRGRNPEGGDKRPELPRRPPTDQ